MPLPLNRRAFERLIQEDLDWLQRQPDTLERRHIEQVLHAAVRLHYPDGQCDVCGLLYENHTMTAAECETWYQRTYPDDNV